MAEQKTQPTQASVRAFLDGVTDSGKRQDCYRLLELMQEVSGHAPQMWGDSIVGFGSYHYKYGSGHQGYAPLLGFSPRKQAISLYLLPALEEYAPLLQKLGRHKAGKGCLYLKKLADVDFKVLEDLVRATAADLQQRYPQQAATGPG